MSNNIFRLVDDTADQFGTAGHIMDQAHHHAGGPDAVVHVAVLEHHFATLAREIFRQIPDFQVRAFFALDLDDLAG